MTEKRSSSNFIQRIKCWLGFHNWGVPENSWMGSIFYEEYRTCGACGATKLFREDLFL